MTFQKVVQFHQQFSSSEARPEVDTKQDEDTTPSSSDLLDVNLFGLSTIWVLLFLTCSLFSLIWHGYFYCICALHIIVKNDRLQRVLRAVTRNGRVYPR